MRVTFGNFQTVAALSVLCFPALSLHDIYSSSQRNDFGNLCSILLSLTYIAFVAVFIPIARTIGTWGRLLWICGYALLFAVPAVRALSHIESFSYDLSGDTLTTLAFAAGFGGFTCFVAIAGRRVPAGTTIELRAPFDSGAYIIVQGGSIGVLNNHAKAPAQRYALDIVRVESGIQMRGFVQRGLADFPSFGVRVYSPCNAIVRTIVDGLSDEGTLAVRRAGGAAGNHVLLEYAGSLVLLAHLKCGSVAVREGEAVVTGQLLGAVGNSGNSLEPHLHIHIERNRRGIPMSFAGRYLIRNSILATASIDE